MMELVSRPHAHNLVRFATGTPEVGVLSADLTSSCEADDFRAAFPERFFSLGMAEQNALSFAGGMAREGFAPFFHTFAVFICRRAFDQLAMSIAYPNLPVRLIGFLPGVTTPGGATHQAIDDLALIRTLPNFTLLECGDATEVESVLEVAHAVPGPVYVRMLRGEVPRLFPASEPMRLGVPRVLSQGTDLALITSGISTLEALRVTGRLAEAGIGITHLHLSTLKPFAAEPVIAAATAARAGVITLENHTIMGGLGSAVAEVMAEAGVGKRLIRLGLRDTYAHGGSRDYLLAHYGLDAHALLNAAEQLLDQPLGLRPLEINELSPAPVDPTAKAEDL